MALRVDAPHVVHETIDGETILIHLGTGNYYSLDGAGSEAWELLAQGGGLDGLLAAAPSRYSGDSANVECGLRELVSELVEQGLLVEVPGADGAGAGAAHLPEGRTPFVKPALQVYTDMQEFMLVDPLHDVDEEAGWPHPRAD